ncbi:hypothetical protein, conserved [Trypanosoma brucei brucei TREU927]|uniref:Uncharacterized protein n=1 Tax=Trypanosoma brucei brucei (strain 927/4 GUTat10.1) TaxID=185431 RepID=Q57U06_TRYB2|nr:hypothetical protein, conserved [Trypanosoma brucei brucei TREU927]AAX70912.1 hypothetical protein, conserved [Trypanosoma brucei]AAZ12113.1 hypothetical protein, conserved [Trypanosoma brucei brucei TREU927]
MRPSRRCSAAEPIKGDVYGKKLPESTSTRSAGPISGTDAEKPVLHVWKNLGDDSGTITSFWKTIKSPNCRYSAMLALRITLVAALPLMLISHFYKEKLPMYAVLGLLGVANSQDTVGEQVSFTITLVQVGVWSTIWGSFLSLFDIPKNEALWWSLAFLGCFAVGLTGNLRCRRQAVLFTIIVMEVQRSKEEWSALTALLVGRDIIMSAFFAQLQAILLPVSMNRRVDREMAKACGYLAAIVRDAAKVCWSKDPLEVQLTLPKLSSDPLQDCFITIPGQLTYVSYEVWVSTRQLELRRERLKVLQDVMPMLHGLTAVARIMSAEGAYRKHRHRSTEKMGEDAIMSTALERLNDSVNCFCDALSNTMEQLSTVLEPRDVIERVPFDEFATATSNLQSALDKLHYDTMAHDFVPEDTVWYMHLVFAHHMMILLGEEIHKYAENLRNFDPSRFKSGSRRFIEFFFLDVFHGFVKMIKNRFTLATPHDVRVFKNAFKIACAYIVGCAYSLYIDKENVYYFGMTILMGVGLPTAGESIMSGVQRVAGLLFSTSLAYAVDRNYHHGWESFVCVLFGVFIALFARVAPAYASCALHCAITLPPSLHVVSDFRLTLSRLVSNAFSVMSYYAIVVFIFPVDPIKVLHNTEVCVVKALSENFSELMGLVHPPVGEGDDEGSEIMSLLLRIKGRREAVWETLKSVRVCMGVAATEPILHGIPYPARGQEEFVPVLRRLAASVDIILLGLLHTHRQRPGGMDHEIQQVFATIQPVVREIDKYSVHVMQDFVDAVHKPMEWSYDLAAEHYSKLRELTVLLRAAFKSVYEDIIAGLRRNAVQIKLGKFPNHNFLDMSCTFDGASFAHDANEMSLSFGDTLRLDELLDCEELTAPRNASFLLAPKDFTINHDMNMSIAILVGINLFCTQLKKTMEATSQLNAFERSRIGS